MVFAKAEVGLILICSVRPRSETWPDQNLRPVASGGTPGGSSPHRKFEPATKYLWNFALNSSLHNVLDCFHCSLLTAVRKVITSEQVLPSNVFFQAGNAPKLFSAFCRGSPLRGLTTSRRPFSRLGRRHRLDISVPRTPAHRRRLDSLFAPMQNATPMQRGAEPSADNVLAKYGSAGPAKIAGPGD